MIGEDCSHIICSEGGSIDSTLCKEGPQPFCCLSSALRVAVLIPFSARMGP